MQTVLVTGVPGWLGNRILQGLTDGIPTAKPDQPVNVRALCLRGSDVCGLRRMGVPLFFGDLRDPISLHRAFKGVDVVIHAAGVIHPKRTRDHFEINVECTKNAIDAAVHGGVKRFIYISSAAAFGFNRNAFEPFNEESDYQPYRSYGESKVEAEQMVRRTQEDELMETVIVRPCGFYGPGHPPRQARFFRMIRDGRPLVFGDGLNLRSMSYVDNTAQAILRMLDHPNAAGQCYWIADKRPYRVLEIYWTIADLLKVRIRPRRLPRAVSAACRAADWVMQKVGKYAPDVHVAGEIDQHITCDTSKAERELGYQPKVELREGMAASIEWCKQMHYL